MYFNYIDDFSDAVPKAICSRYSMYIFSISGYNGELLAKLFSSWHTPAISLKNIVCEQNVNMISMLSIVILVLS